MYTGQYDYQILQQLISINSHEDTIESYLSAINSNILSILQHISNIINPLLVMICLCMWFVVVYKICKK